ncbi:MAG: DUF937 domain-containing protein [Gammaproteobacteria bacterium]|nr:DUF937 domain-containing protein [Gammaproteobacteria bacterium]
MNLLEMLIKAQGGGLVRQMAEQFGVSEVQAGSAVQEMLPSLAEGMRGNIARPGGLNDLLSAIQSGNHSRYVDNPAELARPDTTDDGNGILGHILGSKDRSREVAAQASQRTGIDPKLLKMMLPVIAAMVMGGISKRAGSGGLARQPGLPTQSGGGGLDQLPGGSGGGFGDILGKILDVGAPARDGASHLPPHRGPQDFGTEQNAATAGRKQGGLFDILGKLFRK